MRPRQSGGYTLIEVMLFLAISLVILVGAILAVQGQQQKTQFRGDVDALNSKIQQWLDQVQNGLSGNSSDFLTRNLTCKATQNPVTQLPYGPRYFPQISQAVAGSGNERGANPQCVFMGLAIVVSNSSCCNSAIAAIPIVGLRTSGTTNPNLNIPAASIADADPIAVVPQTLSGVTLSDVDLSETYTLPPGVQVLSWKDSSSRPSALSPTFTCAKGYCSELAGFFTSFNGAGNTPQGGQSMIAVQYPFFNPTNAQSESALINSTAGCIRMDHGSQCSRANLTSTGTYSNLVGPNETALVKWQLCISAYQDVKTARSAILSINSDNGYGVSTNINYFEGTVKIGGVYVACQFS